jgi:hypothetical protein
MKWLRKAIVSWLGVYSAHDDKEDAIQKDIWLDKEEDNAYSQTSPSCDPVLNFKIYNAHGGKIVEFSSHKNISKNTLGSGRPDTELYIITDAEDFGTAIMNIAVMQRLRTGV